MVDPAGRDGASDLMQIRAAVAAHRPILAETGMRGGLSRLDGLCCASAKNTGPRRTQRFRDSMTSQHIFEPTVR
jgi:hypothetical protein